MTRGTLLLVAAAAFAVAACGRAAEASEPARQKTVSAGGVTVSAASADLRESESEYEVFAADVVITWPYAAFDGSGGTATATLRAGSAVVWIAREKLPAAAKPAASPALGQGAKMLELGESMGVAVYAEGDVRVDWGGDRIECERFVYDFKKRRGVAVRAKADIGAAFGKTPMPEGTRIIARADEIRVALRADGGGTIEIENASVTDCDYHVPHWDIKASEVVIEIGSGKRPDVWLTLYDVVPRAFGIPLFYLPAMAWNAAWRPMIRITPGSSAQYGWFLRLGVGMEIKTWAGEKGDRRRRLATVWFLGDWFDRRGPGAGIEAKWGRAGEDGFKGEALLYYVNDRGDDRDTARAMGFYPVEQRDRWRAFVWHRQRISALDARVDFEINALGDRNFLQEFFETEYRTEKPPESRIEFTRTWGSHCLSATLKPRLNTFLDDVEYLPRVSYDMISMPHPFNALIFDAGFDLSHARVRPDNGDDSARSYRLWRFDGSGQASLPFRALVFEVEPYFLTRYTWFSRSLAEKTSIDRGVLEAGAKTTIQAWRDFGGWESAGVESFRHVAALRLSYSDRFVVTTPSSALVPVDETEQVDLGRRFDLRFTTRLTAWLKGDRAAAGMDVFFLEAEGSYYPDPARDNASNRFGPVTFDLKFRPASVLGFEAFAVYELNQGRFLRWDASASFTPSRNARFSISTSNATSIAHTTSASAALRFDDRWEIEGRIMYDFMAGREASWSVTVRRILHRWVLEASVSGDASRDDIGFSISFLPLIAAKEAWN